MRIRLLSTLLASASILVLGGCSFPNLNKEISDPAPVEAPVEISYDKTFLENVAKGVVMKQDYLQKIGYSINREQIIETEINMHEDYATKKFDDEILKLYATNYLQALKDDLELTKKSYDEELTPYEEFVLYEGTSNRIMDVVVSLINDYDLDIPEELKKAYINAQRISEVGNYIILEKAEVDINYNEESGMTEIKYKCKNPSIYDYSDIEIEVTAIEELSDGTWRVSPNTPVRAKIDEWKSNEDFDITIEVMGNFNKDHLDFRCVGGIWF